MNPKYVLLHDGTVVMGRAGLHMDLHTPNSEIKSGGWWHLSPDKQVLNLYGASVDFGAATEEDVIKSFKANSHIVKYKFKDVIIINHSYAHSVTEPLLPFKRILEWDPGNIEFVEPKTD